MVKVRPPDRLKLRLGVGSRVSVSCCMASSLRAYPDVGVFGPNRVGLTVPMRAQPGSGGQASFDLIDSVDLTLRRSGEAPQWPIAWIWASARSGPCGRLGRRSGAGSRRAARRRTGDLPPDRTRMGDEAAKWGMSRDTPAAIVCLKGPRTPAATAARGGRMADPLSIVTAVRAGVARIPRTRRHRSCHGPVG
jgi:hypothetical protein